ncbi:MAG: LuxR C-terminal-related transcriptional regulator [Pseudomonadota bacterium]|nr:LuxR C-terminal-related transcriptional regulator [Pseudomonadota bacterium]
MNAWTAPATGAIIAGCERRGGLVQAGLDMDAVRTALGRIERAGDFDAAERGVVAFAAAIGLPVIAWAPDVSRPAFDPQMYGFMQRRGWSEEVLELWWGRAVMMKSPLYTRCRTRALPFLVDVGRDVSGLMPEARAIHQALKDMGLAAMITVPIHLPRGQVAQLTFGGAMAPDGAAEVLAAARAELVAAGQFFMHAVMQAAGPDIPAEGARAKLTPKEWECLRLTAQGHREAEVADLLAVKPSTVRYHLRNVEAKLGAATRTHAVALAAQLGLLGPISE